jgi:hypothetical protein
MITEKEQLLAYLWVSIIFICIILFIIIVFLSNDNKNDNKNEYTNNTTSYKQNNSYYDNPLKYKEEYDSNSPKYINYDNNVVNTSKYTSKYDKFLHDDRWYAKRRKILDRDNHKCQWCGKTTNLQVHHKYYNVYPNGKHPEPWDYPDDALMTLCRDCHTKYHEKYTVKQYYRKKHKHFKLL